MKKLHRALILSLLVILTIFLSACMKAVALDEYAYVIAIGADEGKIKSYNISFLIQKEGGGEDGQENAGAKVLSAEAETLSEALKSVELAYPSVLNLSRVTLIVVSDGLARSGDLIKSVSIAKNSYHVRRSVKLMVAQNSASDYLNGLNVESEANVTKLLVAMMNDNIENGAAPLMNIALFTEATKGGRSDAVMPFCATHDSTSSETKKEGEAAVTAQGRTGTMDVYVSGMAIFNGEKMCGSLPQSDVCFALLGRSELKECFIDVPFMNELVSVRLFKVKQSTRASIAEGLPYVKIDAELDCELLASPKQAMSSSDIANTIEKYLHDGLNRVFKFGKNLNSDILGLGRNVSQCFSSSAEWTDYDWKSKLMLCEAEYDIKVNINDRTLVWEVSG